MVSQVRLGTGIDYELLSFPAEDPTSDRTLLLVHGFYDLGWGWLPLVETGRFRRFHVLAPSMRGHGKSGWIGDGATYYFMDYVADLESLVASHARSRLAIVGHSMGGMIASYFAGTYPDRVEQLAVLEGLSVPEHPTGPERLRDAIAGRRQALAARGTQAAPGGKRFASLDEAAARMRHHDPKLDPRLARRLAEHACVELSGGEWVYRHDPLHVPRTPIGFEVAVAQRFWRAVKADLLYLEGEASPFRLGGEVRADRLGAFKAA